MPINAKKGITTMTSKNVTLQESPAEDCGPSGSASVVLTAEFTARPDNVNMVAEILDALAEQVRQEARNIAFECYQRADDSSKFFVYEIYRDREAFDLHLAADYGATFNARLKGLIVEPHSSLSFLMPLLTQR